MEESQTLTPERSASGSFPCPCRPGVAFRAAALCLLLGIQAATPALAQNVAHPAGDLPVPRSHLTREELDLAIRVAVGGGVESPSRRSADRIARTVVARAQLAVGDKKEPGSLHAIVTTYDYDRHRTTRSLVDLNRQETVRTRITNDASAPLAPVEMNEAGRLILEDSRVSRLLGASLNDVELEFLNPTIEDRDHPCFGKRVALVLFRTDRGYRTGLPPVFANLTDGVVVLEE